MSLFRPKDRTLPELIALGLLAGAVLVATPTAMQRTARPSRQVGTINGRHAMAGEVLVKFRRPLASRERVQVEQEIDADQSSTIGRAGARRLHSRRFDTSTLVAVLRNHPDVEYVEPNYVVQSDTIPNDPFFGQLWGLLNVGQTVGTPGTPGADISATLAWDVSTGSRANVIAVIDTGIDYTHSDLAANVWSAPAPFSVTIGGQAITCAAGTHGFNAITRTCDPRDDNGHGTHVSGTIGAIGENDRGVVGVNWTASIMASKFLDANGLGTTADAINAIEFVIQASAATGANVRVLSNSWSSGGFSQALLDEINSAGANDMLFVASAGNNTSNNDTLARFPANYGAAPYNAPNVIAVASTDNRDALAGNSNYGPSSVHLAAPGVNILSTVPFDVYGQEYQYLSGTSMAVPHVSGAAALVLSRCALNAAALKNALMNTVDPIPLLAGRVVTGGRLNVNTAVRNCAATPDFSLSASPSTQTVPAGSGTPVNYRVDVTPSGGFAGTITFSVSGLPSGATATFSPSSITTSGSSTMTVTPSPSTPGGTFPLTITGTSGALTRTASVTFVQTSSAPAAVDQIVFSDGAGTRTTPPFSTSAAQETLIAFAASDGPLSGGQVLTVTGAGPDLDSREAGERRSRHGGNLADEHDGPAVQPDGASDTTLRRIRSIAHRRDVRRRRWNRRSRWRERGERGAERLADHDAIGVARVCGGERLGSRHRSHGEQWSDDRARMGGHESWRYVLDADANSSSPRGGNGRRSQRRSARNRSLELRGRRDSAG
jgi:subtilisin family serine protease